MPVCGLVLFNFINAEQEDPMPRTQPPKNENIKPRCPFIFPLIHISFTLKL